MTKIKSLLLLFVSLFVLQNSIAQEKLLSVEDAVIGMWRDYYPEHIRNLSWRPDCTNYTFIEETSLLQSSFDDPKKEKLTDLDEINSALKKKEIDELSYLPSVSWIDNKTIRLTVSGNIVEYDIEKKQIIKTLSIPDKAENTDLSPDGNSLAFTIKNNVLVKTDDGQAKNISNSRDLEIVSGQSIARREFGISGGTFWSDDSKKLAYYVKDESAVHDYPLVNVTTRIATVDNTKYPMAGMASEKASVVVYDIENDSKTKLQTKGEREQYLTNLTWTPNSKQIILAVVNRDQNHMKLNIYDAETGKFLKTLFEEKHEKYVEPLHPAIFIPGNSKEFIWQSRRDGFNHLYLYNMKGKLIKQITSGDWLVTDVLGFDNKSQNIFIQATKESPIENHIYKVNIKSGKMTKLTNEPGMHGARLSQKGDYLIDNYSSTEVPNAYQIISAEGKIVKKLLVAENPMKELKPVDMSIGTIKAADGETDLYYRLIKPADFDPTKKYPVVVYVYGGPHAQLISNSWMGGARGWQYYMAQQGYVMFTLDNRGSSNRGMEFESATFRQLGIKEMEDQIKGIEFLKSKPWVDQDRMGVHGWSFGGYMTTGLMLNYPDVFKVGVAGGPVTDWKYYEVMYGERYMDTPEDNPEGYEKTSLNTKVDSLKGKLLIIHGGIDPTVVQQHSLVFVRECIKKRVPVDYFVYPRAEHNVRGYDRIHLMEKVSAYFDDYLK